MISLTKNILDIRLCICLMKAKINNKKVLFYLAILILFLIAVVPQFDQLITGIKEIQNASVYWLLAAILFFIFTYVSAAVTYQLLAKHKLKFIKTLFVQVACSFANRLLPGGLGGLGLNIDYLIKNKHNSAQASSVAAMNTFVALVSHGLLFFIAIITAQDSIKNLITQNSRFLWAIPMLFAIGLTSIVVINKIPGLNKKISKFISDTWRNIIAYKGSLGKVLLAILTASATTGFYVLALFACAHSLGVSLDLLQAFLIYTLGVAVGAVLVTPGGLGGAEAGLYAGMVGYGYEPSLVFSIVIIFRFIIFWLPILPGYFVFTLLRKLKVI